MRLRLSTVVAVLFLLAGCAGMKGPGSAALKAPAHTPDSETKRELHADSAREASEFWLGQRVPAGSDVRLTERYEAAGKRAESMRVYSLAAGRSVETPARTGSLEPRGAPVPLGSWTPLGPGNLGGRTRALIVNPKNPSLIYAAAETGGIWKSTDAGATWNAVADLTPNIYANTMVMDPANQDILYVGTGADLSDKRGGGVLRTTDAGVTWTVLPGTTTPDFWFINKMAVTPAGNLYAATPTGVFQSLDKGMTWNPSVTSPNCEDIAVRTDQPTDYLFATCTPDPKSTQRAILRNQDAAGAGKWVNVFTAPNMARTSLAIAPSSPSTMYAMAWSTDPQPKDRTGLIGVFQSLSSGDSGSWTIQTSNQDSNLLNSAILSYHDGVFGPVCSGPDTAADFSGQGWSNNVLAVDPVDPTRLWAGGIDLYRSDDSGRNWGLASYWERAGNPEYTHADQHAFVFHPGYDGGANQTLFVSNDGGIYRTDNARAPVATSARAACAGSKGQVTWTSLNHKYVAFQFYHGLPFPGDAAYFGGSQDNGVQAGQDKTGIDGWVQVDGGDGGWVAIDPKDPNNIYFEYTNKSTSRSTDGGRTKLDATNGITEPKDSFLFIKQFVMDPSNSKRLYLGGKQLWKTEDGAQNWSPVSAPIGEARVTAIAVAPSDPNTVYFGSVSGSVYASSSALKADGSTAWTKSTPRDGANLQSLTVDPGNPQLVYATYTSFKQSPDTSHIYRTADGGSTWQGIDGVGNDGIPDIPVSSLLVDPLNRSNLYAGTDLGVFVSMDAGATWSRDANNFANTAVSSMTLDRSTGVTNLFAFTYGRGAWRVTLPNSGTACTYAVSDSTVAIPAAGGSFTLTVTTGAGCGWSARPGPNFVNIGSPAGGNGSGGLTLNAAANPGGARSETISIQGQVVTVNQAGQQ
jgi:photosystem II stability/assembly factor-like uncharacterized protein